MTTLTQYITDFDALIEDIKTCNTMKNPSVAMQANCINAKTQAKLIIDKCSGKSTSSDNGVLGDIASGISGLFGSGETAAQKEQQKQLCNTYGTKLSTAYYEGQYTWDINIWKYVPYIIGIIIIVVIIMIYFKKHI